MIIDAYDARILVELQADSTLTAETLGARVCLSGSAVAKRLAKLKRSGLIARMVAVLDLQCLGPSVTALVMLVFEHNGPLTTDEFVRLVAPRPEVTNALVLSGEIDVAVTIMTRTLDECSAAIRALQQDFPQVRQLRKHVVLAQPKRSLAVPFPLTGLSVGTDL